MKFSSSLVALSLALLSFQTLAQTTPEALIRKNLPARLSNFPAIDEVKPAPIAGLYEVRLNGSDIVYTDAKGDFLIQGEIIDVQKRTNLTKDRIDKLSAIDFKSLPFKDSFTIVRGNGKRKMAVFADPNCGYCKRFEGDLQKINNVTVYLFLLPILGEDSVAKSQAVWCASNKAKSWEDWMLRGTVPNAAKAKCDTSALDRNVAYGQKYKINGTPAIIFADGTRVPGAIKVAEIEAGLGKSK